MKPRDIKFNFDELDFLFSNNAIKRIMKQREDTPYVAEYGRLPEETVGDQIRGFTNQMTKEKG